MASQDQSYSYEFKVKVAEEAIDRDKKNLDKLGEKYDVPVSLILTWAQKYERDPQSLREDSDKHKQVKEPEDDTLVDISIDNKEISESIGYGAMFDDLDIKKLTFWSVLGIIFVIIFVQLLVEMHQLTTQVNMERVSAASEYDVVQQNEKAREQLNNFGVVDIEEGIYRIPIDSVINDMAVDGEQ